MTILVTGGAGYIGSHTVRLLSESGRDVVAFDSMGAVARVSCPTALITPQSSIGDIAAVARAAPEWEFGRVLGTGHYMQIITPDQVEAMITQFLHVHQGGDQL